MTVAEPIRALHGVPGRGGDRVFGHYGFINQVIEMSLQTLPREIRRRWKGNSAVDATVVPTFARPDRRQKRTKKGKAPEVQVHSADTDADWYVRNPSEAKPDGEADKAH